MSWENGSLTNQLNKKPQVCMEFVFYSVGFVSDIFVTWSCLVVGAVNGFKVGFRDPLGIHFVSLAIKR